jgi:hypothetical protein
MKKIVLLCGLLAAMSTQAQDTTIQRMKAEAEKKAKQDSTDTIPERWKTGGLYNLTLSQGSLSNWAAGGEDFNLAMTSVLSLYAFYTHGVWSWDNTLDFFLGFVRTTSTGTRKNDDRIDLYSKMGRALSPKWNFSGLVNFRTQMLKGYSYTEDQKTLTSNFLAPAYLVVSLGFDYKPADRLSILLSPTTGRWVFVKDDSLSAKGSYGVEPGKHTLTEVGAFVSASYYTDPAKSISYRGRLDLFSNYRHKPENIDVFFSNILAVKLVKAISATWNVDLIYDDDVQIFGDNGTSPAVQFKSLVGVGLAVKF